MSDENTIGDRLSEVRASYDRTWARSLFLRAMERVAPHVVRDLQSRLLPRFKQEAPENQEEMREILFTHKQEKITATLAPAVREWCAEHRIFNSDQVQSEHDGSGPNLLSWFEPVVLQSFMCWALHPEEVTPRWHFQDDYSVIARSETPPAFCFETDGWAVLREPASAFRQRVKQLFEATLRQYMAKRLPPDDEHAASAQESFPRLPTKFAPHHFDWLVRYQVLGESFRDIGAVSNDDQNGAGQPHLTAMKGVKTAAEAVIGPAYQKWLRPPSKGGRPKKRT